MQRHSRIKKTKRQKERKGKRTKERKKEGRGYSIMVVSNARRGSLFWLLNSAKSEPENLKGVVSPLCSPCLHLPLISSYAWSTGNLIFCFQMKRSSENVWHRCSLKKCKVKWLNYEGIFFFPFLEDFFNSTGGYALWWLVKKERERKVEVTQNFPCVNFN